MKTKDTSFSKLESSRLIDDWVPKKEVQEFFKYGNTKMSTFATDYNIRTAKVGKRIFYKYSDILRLFKDNMRQ